MYKYRKKSAVIEAFQYEGDLKKSNGEYCVPEWAQKAYKKGILFYRSTEKSPSELFCKTLTGDDIVPIGDFIVRDNYDGGLSVCDGVVFNHLYELADDNSTE